MYREYENKKKQNQIHMSTLSTTATHTADLWLLYCLELCSAFVVAAHIQWSQITKTINKYNIVAIAMRIVCICWARLC